GRPRGVLSTHRATDELFRPGGLPLRLDSTTVMAQAAPPSWDALTLELWGPLRNGGTSVLIDGDHLTPAALRHHIARDGLNTLWLTSSLFNLFVDEDIGSFAGSTQLAIGGERLSPGHVARFVRTYPDIRLFNGYGPAENCVFSTMHRITLADCVGGADIPIGRPVAGTTVFVLDGDRPCGTGEIGELCIAGTRLARGYLGDPCRTRERFRAVDIAGLRVQLYRTGDLGRLDSDGVYHFHARLDRQVRVHGHRVEPVEIERQAGGHPAVAQCVALPETDDHGTVTGLVAAYRTTAGLAPGELRAYLAARLPAYLLPDRLVEVARMPLLDNGKLDPTTLRDLLPAELGTADRRR
ncbi:MAG TPA: AMP-binding protein, partial [Pseudonocardiaceae bacterium]|nr:AMP-binding protein [Pseudonocardiaceae bacterium]